MIILEIIPRFQIRHRLFQPSLYNNNSLVERPQKLRILNSLLSFVGFVNLFHLLCWSWMAIMDDDWTICWWKRSRWKSLIKDRVESLDSIAHYLGSLSDFELCWVDFLIFVRDELFLVDFYDEIWGRIYLQYFEARTFKFLNLLE